ncbi:MAG: hydrogenase maturation protease [Pseudomonadota bacterium]
MAAARILVAGVGNVLHGDDGFGVELAWRLARRALPEGVKVIETGIGGMSLVQEAMQGYDAVLLLDAHASGTSGAVPGTVRLLEPVLPDLSALEPHALRDYFADTHYATPLRALALLERLGRLPRVVAVIGCEPVPGEDTLTLGLSAPVAAALDAAEVLAVAWMSRLGSPTGFSPAPSRAPC